VPEVRVEVKGPAGRYRIRISGDLVAQGEVLVGHQLGIGQDLDVPGIDVEHVADPIYGTRAVWIEERYAGLGEQHGLQMFDPLDVLTTHVAEVLRSHLSELLTREEVAELLNMARQDAPMVVQELVPNMLALGQLRQVLQNLVKEQVPIKDLSTILNSLADNAVYTKDPHALTEHVRAALGRKICARYQSPDGTLKAFMLSPDAERAIQNAIQLNETGQVLMLDPNTSQAIQNNLADALNRFRGQILDPVLVTPPKIRRHVKSLLERNFSKIVVLSYSEIVSGVQIDNLETIDATSDGVVGDWTMTSASSPPLPTDADVVGATRPTGPPAAPIDPSYLLDPNDEDDDTTTGSGAAKDTPSSPGPSDWNW
jgi:flagellar biosynthesis protein FlhA